MKYEALHGRSYQPGEAHVEHRRENRFLLDQDLFGLRQLLEAPGGVRLDLGALDQPVVLRVRETALVERRVRGLYLEEVHRVVVGRHRAAVVEVVVARRRLLEKTVEGQRPHLDFGPEVFLELGLQEGPDVPLPAR
jgi:hypothetical protein